MRFLYFCLYNTFYNIILVFFHIITLASSICYKHIHRSTLKFAPLNLLLLFPFKSYDAIDRLKTVTRAGAAGHCRDLPTYLGRQVDRQCGNRCQRRTFCTVGRMLVGERARLYLPTYLPTYVIERNSGQSAALGRITRSKDRSF